MCVCCMIYLFTFAPATVSVGCAVLCCAVLCCIPPPLQEEKMKQAQFEWGRGAVQKEQTQQTIAQLQAMAEVSLL